MNEEADIKGKITNLAFDKMQGQAMAVSFKIMSADGKNMSHPSAAKLLPWDQLKEFEALAGEPITFQSGELYEIAKNTTGRVLMRSVPEAGDMGDMKIELLYVPHADKPLTKESEAAALKQVSQLMQQTGVIEYPELVGFNEAIKRELDIGGMHAAK
jgi:hypothetical protein